jgi:hypothetical protein
MENRGHILVEHLLLQKLHRNDGIHISRVQICREIQTMI